MTTSDLSTVRAAITLASRAPSVHNTQPWRLVVGPGHIDLVADGGRLLPAADPDGRELVLSCGALLHHLRLALAAYGWRTEVDRFPDPDDLTRLARIRLQAHPTSKDDIADAAAIGRRQTDRRRFTSWPVPEEHLDSMVAAAAPQGVFAVPLTDAGMRMILVTILADSSDRQQVDSEYTDEVVAWSARQSTATDGVLASSVPGGVRTHGDTRMRTFPGGRLVEPDLAGEEDGGQLLVIATADDDPLSWLRAGEATSAALLAATRAGLATCPLSQPLENADTRRLVRHEVLGGLARPQLIIRTGWAATSAPPLPWSPRRPIDDFTEMTVTTDRSAPCANP